MSDREVVRRVQAGESILFELLFRRHRQRVYRVVRAIVRDESEAADLVQEAYLRGYTHLDQFAGRAKFSTWFTKIAVYLARARARHGVQATARRGLVGAAQSRSPMLRSLVEGR